jgi:hypothetical protein
MVGLTIQRGLFLIGRNANGTAFAPHSKLDGFDVRLSNLHHRLSLSFSEDDSF